MNKRWLVGCGASAIKQVSVQVESKYAVPVVIENDCGWI